MGKTIQDEFTNKKLSRQRKYQLRKSRDGLCCQCGKPTVMGLIFCIECTVDRRDRSRKLKGCKRRYNSLSYLVEKQYLKGRA